MSIPSQHTRAHPTIESDWVVVDRDSWRTSYTSVSWVYDPRPGSVPTASLHSKASHSYTIPRFYAKPPLYYDTLCASPSLSQSDSHPSLDYVSNSHDPPSDVQSDIVGARDVLDPDNIGVKLANEALAIYEIHVGFHCTTSLPAPGPALRAPSLASNVNRGAVALARRRCGEVIQDSKNSMLPQISKNINAVLHAAPTFSTSSSNHRSQSLRWDGYAPNATAGAKLQISISSLHSPSNHSISQAESPQHVTRVLPTPHFMTPIRSVSTASTQPSPPSSLPLALTNFTFPSLNEPRHLSSTPNTHSKQGTRKVYHEHISTHTSKASSTSPKSSTRALVTMLRAAGKKSGNDTTPISSPSSSPRPADSPTSSSEISNSVDLDFFVPANSGASEDDSTSFSSQSSPALSAKGYEDDGDGWVVTPAVDVSTLTNQIGEEREQPPSAVPLANDEGWIEGPPPSPAQRSPKVFLRKHPSRILLLNVTAPPPPPWQPIVYSPAPYPTPVLAPAMSPIPYPYHANSYLPMQMHIQAQMQHQMPMHSSGSVLRADWYRPQSGFVPTLDALSSPLGTSAMSYYRMPPVEYPPVTGAAGAWHW